MLIDYKNVSISRDDKVVLSGVNFHADAGELIYITGRVGSGKTSLLKTFYAELEPDSIEGESTAVVLDRDMYHIKRRDIPQLRREMGIVFQDFQLLADRSVARNLEFVLKATGWKHKSDIRERVEKVLELVGMQEMGDKMPHELSGGEQQRVAIARALLNEPKIIVADEPTANLDQETARSIAGLLKDACGHDTAVVVTTHNPALIKAFPGVEYRCVGGHLKCITEEKSKIDHPLIEETNNSNTIQP